MATYANFNVKGVLESKVSASGKQLVGVVKLDDSLGFLNKFGNGGTIVHEYVGPAQLDGKLCNVRVDATWSLNNDHLLLKSTGSPQVLTS